MQESRLFRIVYELLNRGQVTAAELAEKMEVSVRTIYRDIDMISSAGIPIYAATGRGGGIRIFEEFVMDKSLLSEQEMRDILFGLKSLAAAQYPDTEAILKKLNAAFQIADTDWISVDFSRWGSVAKKEQQVFALLKTAVLNQREIQFEYHGTSGMPSERICQPLKLVYKDRAWYVYGYCLLRDGCRLFRISRMKQITLLETGFEREADHFPALLPAADELGEPIHVKLLFAPNTAYRLYDIFDEDVIKETEAGYLVEVTLPKNEWLTGFLMSFGDRVSVMNPPELRCEIMERHKAAWQHIERQMGR